MADDDDGDGGSDGAGDVLPGNGLCHRAAGEQRHGGDQRDEGKVLEQQHREGVAAGMRGKQVALGQHGEHDCGRGEREAGAEHQGRGPVGAEEAHANGDRDRGQDHLSGAEAEYGAAHDPEALRAKLEADQEQEHDHAELGDAGDLVDIGDEAEGRGADRGAGD